MEDKSVDSILIRKYNIPVPRYTSYPPVPVWHDKADVDQWKSLFQETFSAQNHLNGLSVYVHLPFCESLCTYCGCNKKITANHTVEEEYISALQKEWLMYRKLMTQTPVIREIHLGGGTPTFFSPSNLKRIANIILKGSIIHPSHEFSIEGHPNNTTGEHLKVLAALGFRRISYGVQDNDAEVQRIINRIQPLENVTRATTLAREHGFRSVNFDLIYGLPRQTIESITRTINEVVQIRPDRITLYSYAHVPWTGRSQRLFDESDLPQAEQKVNLYITSKELLLGAGYVDIGMDHFALKTDDLFKAWQAGRLHRNFMGYTTLRSVMLMGLGVSAISDVGNSFMQNEKTLHEYYAAINNGCLASKRSYTLTAADISIRKYILDISCKGETTLDAKHIPLFLHNCFPKLEQLQRDGLIEWKDNEIKVTAQGRYFLRNICSAFDQYLTGRADSPNQFSKAV